MEATATPPKPRKGKRAYLILANQSGSGDLRVYRIASEDGRLTHVQTLAVGGSPTFVGVVLLPRRAPLYASWVMRALSLLAVAVAALLTGCGGPEGQVIQHWTLHTSDSTRT